MATMIPFKKSRPILPDLMNDPFDSLFDAVSQMPRPMSHLMRTDIKETSDGYTITVDLPGFKKENVQADIAEGYLTISAKAERDDAEKDEKGSYVRKERFSGTCNRRFFVGDDIREDDIKASFDNGVLCIHLPKKEEDPKPEKKSIAIEG